MHQRMRLKLLVALLLSSFTALATNVGTRVDNFRLLDHLGNSHELYYYRDAPAIAVFVYGNGCESSRASFVELDRLFAGEGVEFFMLNSAPDTARPSLASIGEEVPILLDETGIIGQALAAATPGEVLVIDPSSWSLVYRGGIGASTAHRIDSPTNLYGALTSLVGGQSVATELSVANDCKTTAAATSTNADTLNISYADDVAPILLDKCVSCHREGGIGPWAMADYDMVRGFSLMMREVIRTKRMPPWHADPDIGHWSNDRSMTNNEVQTLINWIEAGTPRDGEIDPLAEADSNSRTWEVAEILGEPDYVIELPATEIPATGVIDYLDIYIDNPIDDDVWVQAAEVLPGDRSVLHHTITTYGERTWFDKLTGDISKRGALRHYAPGITNRPFPRDTGIFLPSDATFEFQMHYTTTGKAAVDQTRVGIWVYDEPPTHSMQSFFMQNRDISIPANAANHKEEETAVVPKDALLYSLLPHAHYRGKSAQFRAVYPNGEEEVLLSVPNYDFNWQTAYEFSEPKFVPAGTRLILTNWWDNSSRNLANPDPTRDVEWGNQSWEEMLFGEVTLRFVDEEETARQLDIVSQKHSQQGN